MPVGVTELVKTNDLVIGLHRFFVAFQSTISCDTVPFKVSKQRDYGPGTLLRLLQLSNVLNHRISVFAKEFIDERVITSLLPQVHTPDGLLFVSEKTKIS